MDRKTHTNGLIPVTRINLVCITIPWTDMKEPGNPDLPPPQIGPRFVNAL